MTQKYTDKEYLNAELFEDRDCEIRCLTRKIVVTRKPYRCAFADVLDKSHDISSGTRVVKESAIAEGEWGSCYSCLPCIDVWLRSFEGFTRLTLCLTLARGWGRVKRLIFPDKTMNYML